MLEIDEPSVTFRGHNEAVAFFEPFGSDVKINSDQLPDLDQNYTKPSQFNNFLVNRNKLIKFGVAALTILIFLWCIVTSFLYLSNQSNTTVLVNQVQDLKLVLFEMKTNLSLLQTNVDDNAIAVQKIELGLESMREESNLTAEEIWNEIKSHENFKMDLASKVKVLNDSLVGFNENLDNVSSVQQSHQRSIAEHAQFIDLKNKEAPFSDGHVYIFTCVANRLVLDVAYFRTSDGAHVMSHGLNNGLNQKWKSMTAGPNWSLSTAMATNVVKGLDQDISTGKVQLWSYGHNLNQEWHTRKVLPFNDVYMIISAANDKAITSNGLGQSPTCEPQDITNPLQHWKIQKV